MKVRFLSMILVALVIFAGCEKDDNITTPNAYTPTDSTWTDGAGGYNVRLNATTVGHYRYYDLTNRQVVEISDAASHSNGLWQVAFSRYLGKTNGGASGSANMKAVDLAAVGLADSVNFEAIATAPAIADSLWHVDETTFAISSDWYIYTGPPLHQILSARKTYYVKSAAGKYAKMTIDTLRNSTMSSAGIATVRFVYQADGSTTFTESVHTVDLNATAGPAYLSFATGAAVVIADPLSSMAWDVMLDGYDIKLNGTIHGPGAAGALESELSFELTTSVPAGAPFFQDNYLSVFGDASTNSWFSYGAQHELGSKNHVYLLKTAGGTVFKMQMKNYYLIVNGASQSGWIQFRFKQL